MTKEPTNTQLLEFMRENFKEVRDEISHLNTRFDDGFSKLDGFVSRIKDVEDEQDTGNTQFDRLEKRVVNLEKHAGVEQ